MTAVQGLSLEAVLLPQVTVPGNIQLLKIHMSLTFSYSISADLLLNSLSARVKLRTARKFILLIINIVVT